MFLKFLIVFKKIEDWIYRIGGKRKTIERRLLDCGAESVQGQPLMSMGNIDKKTLRTKISAYDCVVFITNYMGHMEYYMGKDIASESGIKMIHCHGGISRLLVELGKVRSRVKKIKELRG